MLYIICICPPEPPTNVQAFDATSDTITVTWTKGSNGGHQQTFVLVIVETATNKTSHRETTENDNDDYTYKASGLKPSTQYRLFLFSKNQEGNSTNTTFIPIHISTIGKQPYSHFIFISNEPKAQVRLLISLPRGCP